VNRENYCTCFEQIDGWMRCPLHSNVEKFRAFCEEQQKVIARLREEGDRLREALINQKYQWQRFHVSALFEVQFAEYRIEEIDAALSASEQKEPK